MSFRARLATFFILIVVIPMAAVGVLVFSLIDQSQAGKTDARAAGIAATAQNVYANASRSASLDARTRRSGGCRYAGRAGAPPGGDARPRGRPGPRRGAARLGPADHRRRSHRGRSGHRGRPSDAVPASLVGGGVRAHRGRLCTLARRPGHPGRRPFRRHDVGRDAARGRAPAAARPARDGRHRPQPLPRRHRAHDRLSPDPDRGLRAVQCGRHRRVAERGPDAGGRVHRCLPHPRVLLRAARHPRPPGAVGALPGRGSPAGQR